MARRFPNHRILLTLLGTLFCSPFLASSAEAAESNKATSDKLEKVDFNSQARPILSAHCFKCHGPDDGQRQSGLRLDLREKALAEADSGSPAILPGKPAESEFIKRILSDDPDQLMPPPSANKPLTAEEKKILRRWVAEGAEYATHWSFVPPRQAPLPKVAQESWPRNAIDYFVLARLEDGGPATLARGRSLRACATVVPGPHRLAADARGSRRLREG